MDNVPVIDLVEALNRSMGDVPFLKTMLDELKNTIPEFMTRIQNAHQDGKMDALSKDAHQFKGAAANLGAKTIAAAAMKLEQLAKNGDLKGCGQALEELKKATSEFDLKLGQIDWSRLPPE